MNTHQLKTFLAVVSEGSFSKAAKAVRVSQSTASLHVRELEDGLGVRLLERGKSGVLPTSSGRILVGYADRLIGLEKETIAQVRAHASAPAGRLAISASSEPGEYHLPCLLAAFKLSNPYVNLEVSVTSTEGALAELRAGDCEIAFIGARPAEADVVCTPFAEDEIVLVGTPDLPTPDKARFSYVARGEGSGTRQTVQSLLPAGAQPAIVAGSSESVRRCALAGVAVAFLSRAAISEDVKQGRLREIPWPGTPLRRDLFVARIEGMPLSAGARALLAHLGSAVD
jgi:DNA-binding transcriptional LysR family regulator